MRLNATLLGMAVCFLVGVVADVLSTSPMALVADGGATGAAAFVLGVTVSELQRLTEFALR